MNCSILISLSMIISQHSTYHQLSQTSADGCYAARSRLG